MALYTELEDASLTSPQAAASSGVVESDRAAAERRVGWVLAGRFELLNLVGAGAYGDVYEVRDRHSPGATLALKLLRRQGPHALYRFKREFRGLTELSHPNLVTLHELYLLDPYHAFFTMELLHGQDLLSFVRPGDALDEVRLRSAFRGLVEGVSALHARGLLHRDLKPANVLVDPSGRAVVVDFGLATTFDAREPDAGPGFAGTLLFAAPEQLASDGSVGPPSDWYAVGVMLYQALSGRPPHDLPSDQIAHAKLQPPAPLPTLPPTAAPLGVLCMRLLHLDPNERPGASALRAALDPSVTSLPAPLQPQRTPKFVGRQDELARLHAAFSAVANGSRTIALVTAPSGLGKTTLVERFLKDLDPTQALVLRGRCYVNEEVPYRALDGLIDALACHLGGLPPPLLSQLLPDDIGALAPLFPVLLRVPAVASAPTPFYPGSEPGVDLRERGALALRALLTRIGERVPLALFIDDLQWDDADSAWLLAALMAEPAPPRLLLVAACRSQEKPRSHVLQTLSRDASVARATQEIALRALTHDEATALVLDALREETPSSALAAEIAEASAGHPMFAIELARHHSGARCGAAVPSLEAAIQDRVRNRSAAAQQLLELICVAGHKLTLRAALRTSGGELPAVRELVACKLATATGLSPGDTLEPYHDRVREALLQEVPPEKMRHLRRSLAEVLAEEADPRWDRVVEHYLAAGLPKDAARYALLAADHAESVLALHRMPALLRLAITYAPGEARAALYVRLARACARLSRTDEAASAFQAAAELETDAAQRWELRRMAMWQALQGGDLAFGLSLLRTLDRPFGRARVRPSAWGLLRNLSRLLRWRVLGPPTLRSPERAMLGHAGDERKQLRLVWSAATGLAMNSTARASYFMISAFHMAAQLGDASVYAPMLAGFVAAPAIRVGSPCPAVEIGIARAFALAQACEDESAAHMVALIQTAYFLFTAQPKRAEAVIGALLQTSLADTEVAAHLKATVRELAPPIFLWAGSPTRTMAYASAWIREAREQSEPRLEHGLTALAAYRFLCDDDVERALTEWLGVCAADPRHSVHSDALWGALIGLYAGRMDVAEQALSLTRRNLWNTYAAQGRSVYHWTAGAVAAARIAASDRRLGPRVTLDAAIASLGLEGALLAAPMRQHLLAARAFARGVPTRGVAHLEEAQQGYARLGCSLFAASASQALSVLHPQRPTRLTHAELARRVFEAERIARPDGWVRALLPGIPGFGATPLAGW